MPSNKKSSTNEAVKEKETVEQEVIKFNVKVPPKASDKIISIKPNERVENENKKLEEKLWGEIKTAQINQTPCYGTIVGLKTVGNTQACVTNFEIELNGKTLKQMVLIPMSQMGYILDATEDENDNETAKRMGRLTNARLGSEIEYLIVGFSKKDKIVYGSRKRAIIDKIRTHYVTPDKNGYVMTYSGCVVEARILSVGDKTLRIEAGGVETTLRTTNITKVWQDHSSIEDKYEVGDSIQVTIDEVIYPNLIDGVNYDKVKNSMKDPFYQGIEIKCHATELDNENRKEDYESVNINELYTGNIVQINSGHCLIRLECGNGVNSVAYQCDDSREPAVGDNISFLCLRKKESNLSVSGKITRIIKRGRR